MASGVLVVDCSGEPCRVVLGGEQSLVVRELGPHPVTVLGATVAEMTSGHSPSVIGYVSAPGSVLVQRAAAAFVRVYAATLRVPIVSFTAMEATARWLGTQGVVRAVVVEPLGRRRAIVAEVAPRLVPPVRAVSVVARDAIPVPGEGVTAGTLGTRGRPDAAFVVDLVVTERDAGHVTAPEQLAPVYLTDAGARRSFLERGEDGTVRRIGD